ncbi:MAG: hypothetical protein HOM11_09510 [Methylococcales bacterium]|mgnify:CR=1 FL=1|jgi:hypothetical protein|nr:hypothetical protein [Methylococcales bacterium]MBT7445145.1 hypothetical protein [Methylococcales bacterium]
MGDVIPFKKKSLKEKHKGKSLCKNGLHKWVVDKHQPFDVKTGKLITVYRCSRCNASKTKSH